MNQDRPSRVSVIVPAYNAGLYIREALESILAQTSPANEIIVVDDGSTDDTAIQVASVSNASLRYVHQSNAGVSAARNTGMRLATGDYIAFLDADDVWHPTMLAEHLRMHEVMPELVLSFSDFERFADETRTVIGTQFVFYRELDDVPVDAIGNSGWLITGDAFCELVRFGDFPGFTQAMMFNRRLLDGLEFDRELRICEDAHFVLRASTRGRVAFTRSVLAMVRRHETNATAEYSGIPLHKLAALLRLESFVESAAYRRCLDVRLSRAHFDVAKLHVRQKQFGEGLHHWLYAVRRPAPLAKRVRSSIGLLMQLIGKS